MHTLKTVIAIAGLLLVPRVGITAGQNVNLHGDWAFQLDENKAGLRERWFNRELTDTIKLPGSTDEAGFGTKSEPDPVRLTREHRYVGPAWYQKTIEIPESWQGKRVVLFLERAMWQTDAWLGDHYLGMQDSLCVPHRFDLTEYLTPGKHKLTIRIDNRLKFNVGHEPIGDPQRGGWSRMWAMSLTEESQGNWNGIIGRMELQVTDPVWIERVEAHPDIEKKEARITAWVRSRVGAVSGELKASASCGGHAMGPVSAKFRTKADAERSARDELAPVLGDLGGVYYERRALTRVELVLPFGEDAGLWDEFSPNIYQLKVELSGSDNGGAIYRDVSRHTFGLRQFVAAGNQFKLNGRTVFIRGNQDNCIHSATAYPPMSKAEWLAFLQKHKDYGLNSMRFHSWCPPKAAFEAADELGMLVHVEGPLWDGSGNIGHLPDRANFIRSETERILDEYGNHPSFVMMAPGNELGNGREFFLQHLVEVWRARDKRHLYTSNCHPFNPGGIDDFFVSAEGIGGLARGLAHEKGKTCFTYEKTVGPFERPFISHEIGQYTSFPDLYGWFSAEKYTGPLKAHYIGMIRERFERFHPAERGPKYAAASGALQVLQYKTELEAMLRTPSMDGYHLNGLMDYPGEGIALIGMLDAMGDSKGLITPEHFRRFCAPTVALVKMAEDELIGGSRFEAEALVRHHGPKDLAESRWHWSIKEPGGKTLVEGEMGPRPVPTGGLTELGKIEAKLPQVTAAQELVLSLRLLDSEVSNEWSFWVFPAEAALAAPAGVVLADHLTDEVRAALADGGSVLLTLGRGSLIDPVPCSFGTVFWGRGLFPNNPRPMGIYCDPAHAALAGFPTRSHAQYQWYSLLTGSAAMKLNKLPFEFEPVVHMIDDFNECERLGLVLEARVGKGRLLATSLNLGADGERTPAQKEMLRSLLARAASSKATSLQALTLEQLATVIRTPRTSRLKKLGGSIAAVSSENPGMERANMIDGDPQTFWHTRFADGFAKPPHFVVLEVPEGTSLAGLTYVAYTGGNGNGHVKACTIHASDDGRNWGEPLAQTALRPGVDAEQKIMFPAPTTSKFIKFEATDAVSAGGQPLASIGELDVIIKEIEAP